MQSQSLSYFWQQSLKSVPALHINDTGITTSLGGIVQAQVVLTSRPWLGGGEGYGS